MSLQKTFEELLETHGAAMWRIARAYAVSESEVEDLHQEILAEVWRSLPSFRGDASIGTWTYRVALNTGLTWRRRAARRVSDGVPLEASANGQGPASRGAPRSESAILADFLGTLRGPDHTVILLYMEGLSYQEISDVTGLSVSLVGVRLHRMKQAFTERYVEG